jgi:retron-type reverse transcriptase
MSEIKSDGEIKQIFNIFKDIVTDYGCDKKDIEKTNYDRKLKRLLRNYHIQNIERAIIDCEYYLDSDYLDKRNIIFEDNIKKLNNYLSKIGGTLYNRKFNREY